MRMWVRPSCKGSLRGGMQETYGEDPHLTGRLAVSFVRGLQGDQQYLKARLPVDGQDCEMCCCHVSPFVGAHS